MNQEILEAVQTLASELKLTDIAHDELGIDGFNKAQECIIATADLVEVLVNRTNEHPSELNAGIVDDVLHGVESKLQNIKTVSSTLDKLANARNTPEFPNQREKLTNQIENSASAIEKITHPLRLDLDVLDLRRVISNEDAEKRVAEQIEKIRRLQESAESGATKINLMLEAVRTESGDAGVKVATSGFSTRRDDHRKRAHQWFLGLLAFGVGTAIAVYYAITEIPEPADLPAVVLFAFRRILLISAVVAGLRLCLKKYNAERNLQIVYGHRQTVLDQYPLFDQAIADDVDAKSKLRLDVAKLVFSDPATGYISAEKGSELNINPMIGAVEKAAKKAVPTQSP